MLSRTAWLCHQYVTVETRTCCSSELCSVGVQVYLSSISDCSGSVQPLLFHCFFGQVRFQQVTQSEMLFFYTLSFSFYFFYCTSDPLNWLKAKHICPQHLLNMCVYFDYSVWALHTLPWLVGRDSSKARVSQVTAAIIVLSHSLNHAQNCLPTHWKILGCNGTADDPPHFVYITLTFSCTRWNFSLT